jgi:hypothetical protein
MIRPIRLIRRIGPIRWLPLIALLALAGTLPAAALDYAGGSNQFAGGFSPSNAPYGGFGGGSCTGTGCCSGYGYSCVN